MGLNIVVCLKPVPDPQCYDQITLDPETKTVKRRGIPTVINPIDKHAIEEALKIKEQHGGKVILLSMAPPETKETILEGLAMGADEAYLLSDRRFAGADTLATSYCLAQGIKKIGAVDLVLTGTESADGATAQVPSQLGEWLGFPHLWGVIECQVKSPQDLYLKTKLERGYMEWSARLPLVLAVDRRINKYRYNSIMGIMKAGKKPFTLWSYDDLKPDDAFIGINGSPTRAGNIFTPDISRKGQLFKGGKEEAVELIMEKLRTGGMYGQIFNGGFNGGMQL